MDNKIRNIVAVVLVILIISVGFLAFINKDSLFKNEVKIKYPDGCEEVYINTKIVTPECIEGRQMTEEQNRLANKGYNYDFDFQIEE